MDGFLESASNLKRNPLSLREAAERLHYSEEPGEWDRLLAPVDLSCCDVAAAKLQEVAPILLGFGSKQYSFIRTVNELRISEMRLLSCSKKVIEELADIPEGISESKDSLYKKALQDIETISSTTTMFHCVASVICDKVETIVELYRRSVAVGDVPFCEWLGPETVVRVTDFFEWACAQDFSLPAELIRAMPSIALKDPAKTIPTMDANSGERPLPSDEPRDYADRLEAKGVHLDEIQYRLYEFRLQRWNFRQWQAHCVANRIHYPQKGTKGESDRSKYGKAYGRSVKRHLSKVK